MTGDHSAPRRTPARNSERVAVVATGGTITNTLGGRVSVDQVLADIGAKYADVDLTSMDIVVEEVLNVAAEALVPDDWLAIARRVAHHGQDPAVDGIVVTHGTYTVEETAYFLHLTMPTEKPIVLVCSQRKHAAIGNDGDKNLIDALRTATDRHARGRGALVLIGDEIHSARDVTKTNQRPGGFSSGAIGILGTIDTDGPTFYRTPLRRHTAGSEFRIGDLSALPRVDIVATYAGADGAAVDGVLAAGARGIIVNGFSFSGRPHPKQLPALEHAAERGVAVALVNRGGAGRVPTDGSHPFLRADDLTAQKARVLLMLGLSRSSDPADLQRIFDLY